jgi:hypothetical protein
LALALIASAEQARRLAAFGACCACQPGALLLKFSLGLSPAQADVTIEEP